MRPVILEGIIWNSSVEMLGLLSEKWPSAADAVLSMSKSKKAPVRFNAICCLREKTPIEITDEVLTSGFADKSSKVRWKAAQTANDLRRLNLIPALSAAVDRENNAKTRLSMEFPLLLLRDGYILKPSSDGRIDVTVRSDRGGIRGKQFSAEELSTKRNRLNSLRTADKQILDHGFTQTFTFLLFKHQPYSPIMLIRRRLCSVISRRVGRDRFGGG